MSSDSECDGSSWEIQKDIGNLAFKNGEFSASVEAYDRAILLQPTEPSLYSNRSMALIKLKKFDLAARDAERCLELDPSFFKAYQRLAVAYCANARFSEASVQLRKGHDHAVKAQNREVAKELETQLRNCALAATSLQQGEKLLAERNYAGAARSLGTALQLFPDTLEVALRFAEVKIMSDPDDAIQVLAKFSTSHNDNPRYFCARALATFYASSSGAKNALLFLREALSLDPDHVPAQKLLKKVRLAENLRTSANTAYAEKRWVEADDGYTQAIAIDPQNRRLNGVLFANRAATRLEMKNYPGALKDADSAIECGNDAPKIYARRARIHEHLGQWDDAVRDMSKAAESERSYEAEAREFKKRQRMSKRKDYYKILGVEKSCNAEDLKRAYKKSAFQWHPDKWANGTDEEKLLAEKNFKELGEAYSLLSDPQKRNLYDSGQMDNEAEGMRGGGGMGQDVDMMSMFNMMFAGGGGMPGGSRRRGNPFGGGGGTYYEF